MNTNESPKKKETVRISKKDLLRLLSENEQQLKHITELQTRLNELLEENRQLKLEKEIQIPDSAPHIDPHPFINPDIYFDGSNGLGSGRRFGSKD